MKTVQRMIPRAYSNSDPRRMTLGVLGASLCFLFWVPGGVNIAMDVSMGTGAVALALTILHLQKWGPDIIEMSRWLFRRVQVEKDEKDDGNKI